MRTGYTDDQYRLVRLGIDRMAKDQYQDYKYKAHKHFKVDGANALYKEVSTAYWKKCVDLYTSPKNLVSTKFNYYSS